MLDIKYVRENQEAVAEAMKNRHASWDAARFSQLDEARRAAITQEEALQAERNAASKAIGQMMAQGKKDEAEAAKERVRAINDQLDVVGREREEADAALRDLLMATPNMPADSTPVGDDEDDNPEVRRWGTPRDFAAEGMDPKPHWDLGPDLGIIDFERAREAHAEPLLPAGRPGRAPGAFAHQLHGRHAFLARLQGMVVPGAGEQGNAHGHRPVAEVRGRPVQDRPAACTSSPRPKCS